jgi:hypothetical protein
MGTIVAIFFGNNWGFADGAREIVRYLAEGTGASGAARVVRVSKYTIPNTLF